MMIFTFGGGPSLPQIPPPPPPPDTSRQDELDRLAEQRASLRKRRIGRESLIIDPSPAPTGQSSKQPGVQIP